MVPWVYGMRERMASFIFFFCSPLVTMLLLFRASSLRDESAFPTHFAKRLPVERVVVNALATSAALPPDIAPSALSFAIVLRTSRSTLAPRERIDAKAAQRVALNVPLFEGLSPTRGEKSTSPAIELCVSNFPLNTNLPASRPTLPIGNSIGPENVTEFPSPVVHVASEALSVPQAFAIGSSNTKVPLPPA